MEKYKVDTHHIVTNNNKVDTTQDPVLEVRQKTKEQRTLFYKTILSYIYLDMFY